MTRILTIIALLFATPAWAGEVDGTVFINLKSFDERWGENRFFLKEYTNKTQFLDRLPEEYEFSEGTAVGFSLPKSFGAFELENGLGVTARYVHEGLRDEKIYLIALIGFNKSEPRMGQVASVTEKDFHSLGTRISSTL